ncbi:MAG: 16S rRNA (cytosine(1402)-N(4))-methyltransferase RsmH [Candidatus Peribacteraceae bacterium]|nr:16S rRNA (cytosine(1402)-N(4))-methyltransferase RsmH [Candidatus Peribacteraceae bacterium]
MQKLALNPSNGHVPVLANEVLTILAPAPGESVLDCTLGLGGHAGLFLNAVSPGGQLIGLDADHTNLVAAKKHLHSFESQIQLHRMNFRNASSIPGLPIDIVFADLGLSSPHVDDPERGFTYRASGPLDLRYDRSSGQSAAEFILSSSVEEITKVLREFGEIQRSYQLAKGLHIHFHTEARHLNDWKTDDVVQCVEKVFTYRAPKVLPQVFQALRIAVNDELGALRSLLDALPAILKPGGRCGIISYHSLEDRMVKQHFRSLSTPVLDERTGQVATPAPWDLLTRKAVVASAGETSLNPRSRSAKFRAIKRLSFD